MHSDLYYKKLPINIEFCFGDIYNHAPDDFKQYVDSLTPEQLTEFVEENEDKWAKVMYEHLMFNWEEGARLCAEMTEIPENEEEA